MPRTRSNVPDDGFFIPARYPLDRLDGVVLYPPTNGLKRYLTSDIATIKPYDIVMTNYVPD
jgi:hypothetical protein